MRAPGPHAPGPTCRDASPPVDVTLGQAYLLVHCVPQLWLQGLEVLPHGREQTAVDRIHHLEWSPWGLTRCQDSRRGPGGAQGGREEATGLRFPPLPAPHPAEAGLPAELVAAGSAEVIVGPEGLVERGDQVEEGLPAALVAEGALILSPLALAQSAQRSMSAVLPCTPWPRAHRPGLAHLLGLRPEVWGGDSASSTCGWPSWQNCLNMCLSSPAILHE